MFKYAENVTQETRLMQKTVGDAVVLVLDQNVENGQAKSAIYEEIK